MPQFLVSSGLPDLPVGISDKDAALVSPLYRAISALTQQLAELTGNIQYDQSEQAVIDQLGGVIDGREYKIYVKALETIGYGQLITLSVDAGKLSARVATGTTLTKPAHALCDVPGGIAVGKYGLALFMRGKSTAVSGTILGTTYYLSTAGALQAAAPTADGVLNQVVAIGLGSAGVYLNIEPVGQRVSGVYKTTATNLRVQYTNGLFTDHAV